MNKKGFTLVELLAIIVILGLVTGIAITVILTVLSNAKDKSIELTKRNIREQSEKYIYEGFSNSNWKRSNSNEEYKCVTVQDLIDVGYYKQSIIEENKDLIKPTDTIKIVRDANTKAIISKTILNNSDCETDSSISIIECRYPQGWKQEKDVEVHFLNSEYYEKRVYLKNIGSYDLISGLNPQLINDYYISNSDTVHILAKANGLLIADTNENGNQMASVYCNVTEIDRTPPKVKLEVENNNDLKCKITDKESGVESYKLCKIEDTNCNENNSEGYINFVSNPITKNDVSNGYWQCIGKDKAGNTALASVFINNSPNADVSATFIAEELNSSGEVSGNHTGNDWTKKDVKLTGTITTNVDTWYILSDTKVNNPEELTGWTSYNGNGNMETITASQTIHETTNKIYYLYVKYKKGTVTEYIDPAPSAKVKVDKTPPTCTLSIPSNNNANGITVTTTCTDAHSGCTNDSTITDTEVTTDTTYTVKDKVGNKKTCSVSVTKLGYRRYCDESNGEPNTIGIDTGTYRVGCHIVLNKNKFDSMEICGLKSNGDTFCIKKSTTPSLNTLKTKLEDLNPPAGTPRTSTYYIDIKEDTVRKDYIKKEKGLEFCTAHVETKFAKNGFWKKVSEISTIDYNKSRTEKIPYVTPANNSSKAEIKFHTYSCRYKDTVSNDSCAADPGFKYDPSKDMGYTCVKVYHGTI